MTQDSKILSICIPTYNGSKYIKENLDILISQIQENQINDVEIVVSDNCSTDSIPEIMNEYTKKYPSFIKYSRNEKNLGYDGNVMKCCEIAQGKFIHLLGDDDFYTLNGLQRLYSVLTNNKDLSVLVLSNSYLRQDYYLEIVSRKYLNEEFILEDRLYINDSDKFIRDIEDRAWPNTNLVFRKDYFFKIPNIREFYKKDWIHLYILIYIAKKWQNCYLFADKFPIVVDRVGVQTWLNNSDGPRIYFNNLWVYSFLDKLGYDKKVFNWYRKKILYEYSKNIQYRRSTNLFINLKYLIKYFPYFKDIPRFYYSFAPKFIYDKGLKGIFSVTNRYSKERRIKEKILTFCFIDKRISVKRIDKKNFSIYKKFPPKELILLLKGDTYVQAVPSIICRPMLNKLELSSNKNIEEIKLAKHLKSCLKQRYIYYSTFLKLFERFKYLQTK